MLARAQQAAQTAQLTLVELRTRAIAAGMTEDLIDSMDDKMEDADGFLVSWSVYRFHMQMCIGRGTRGGARWKRRTKT